MLSGSTRSSATVPWVSTGEQRLLSGFFIALGTLWSILLFVFLVWSLELVDASVIDAARIQARTAIEKDILYRRWNSLHGGVYGPVSGRLLPNPYLDVPDRDVKTTSGVQLTMINPAYMTRQVHELGATSTGVVGHITSLNPIRPANKADAWETRALQRIETVEAEVSGVQTMNGMEHLRLMLPLKTEAACLKCHAKQGYKVGDIRGGISVSVPLGPLYKNAEQDRYIIVGVSLLAWVFGLLAIHSVATVKKKEKALRVSEAKYRILVETMTEGLQITDRQGNIIFCNACFAGMLGYEAPDMVGMPFSLLVDDANGDFERNWQRAAQGDEAPFEVVLLGKDAGKVVALVSPRAHEDGLLSVVTDITRTKEQERSRVQNQKLESLGHLAGGVAHEINTPVQFIMGNTTYLTEAFSRCSGLLELLQEKLPGMEGCREAKEELDKRMKSAGYDELKQKVPAALEENRVGLHQIASIVASMQELARPGGTGHGWVDVNDVVRKSVEMLGSKWKDVADAATDLQDGLPSVEAAPGDLGQVVINLLMNAAESIKARKEGGPGCEGRIQVSTFLDEHGVRIRVEDDGLGIAPDEMHKIFNPFFSTKDPGVNIGQGLTIAHRIVVEALGGSIDVESEAGNGAVFTVTLPAGGGGEPV